MILHVNAVNTHTILYYIPYGNTGETLIHQVVHLYYPPYAMFKHRSLTCVDTRLGLVRQLPMTFGSGKDIFKKHLNLGMLLFPGKLSLGTLR